MSVTTFVENLLRANLLGHYTPILVEPPNIIVCVSVSVLWWSRGLIVLLQYCRDFGTCPC